YPGQVLILFPGLNRQTANLVGERLRASFVKAASFDNGSCGGFKPRLEYELYSYPHDVEHVGELEKILKSSLKDSKPAHLPVSANLAEEL
ncbi:MAG: hypothetical protein HY541_02100, partial [Deltaproteobacteria bacterium]|nr:hypothetical protein [Deltaproteobacteria bacterium]